MKKLFLGLSSIALLTSNLLGTVYSDGTNPEDWKLYTSSTGEVKENNGTIEFTGNGKQGFYLPLNIKCDTINHEYKLSWKMKSKRYSQTLIQIMTKDGIRYLSYYPLDRNLGKDGRFLKFGLDVQYKHIFPIKRTRDGEWHTFTQNIATQLKHYEPDNELLEIKTFFIRGSVLIDDVEVLTPTLTDTDKFKRAMVLTQSGYSVGSIAYFPEIGIGSSSIHDLANESSFFFAFSDENKNSLTRLNAISAITDGTRVTILPDSGNKRLFISYNCKRENHMIKCLEHKNDRYHDIYDVRNHLNPILISSEVRREGEP